MRKFLITALMVLGLASYSFAQDVTFYIVKTDGTTTSHAMSTNSKIYYSDTQLFLKSDGETVSYNLSELRKAYFTIIDNTEEIDNQQLTIYPNPVKNILNIKNITDNQLVTIYSISGAVMMRTIVSGEAAIDISELHSGMYVVKVGDYVSKFIKM